MDKKQDIEAPEALTAPKKDFSEWYNQIISVAGIIDKRYDVKGMYVWLPYGYSIMQNIKKYWDKIFQEAGLKEAYFPLIVPISYASQNKSWFEGFKDEAFWVGGINEEKFTHILRPTGEPAMYPMFKLWTRTHSDLPIRIYETVSSFRYETKHTRPIIRDREITVWFEIHTAHATKQESDKEVQTHQELYSKIWEKLALPYIRVKKHKWECFPGALGAIEDYTLMPSGKAMENGSINHLGQAYSRAFNIKFKNKNGKDEYVWQVCTGNGARYLAAVIAVHGDDKGLVIPPEIAPIEVVVIPIFSKDDKKTVINKANSIVNSLKRESIKVELDLREDSPGSKFYEWELKGVPLRIEIGPRDIKNKSAKVVRRDTGQKQDIKERVLIKQIKALLDKIQKDMHLRAKSEFKKHLVHITDINEIKEQISNNKTATCIWCGEDKCFDKIKNQDEGIDPFGIDLKSKSGKCIVCNKKASNLLYVSNTY